MAEFVHNNNTMTLFQNQYKKHNDNKPDYNGKGVIEGMEKQISCWVKQTRNGDDFLSCQVQDSYVKPVAQPSVPVTDTKKFDEAGNELNPNYNPNPINNDFDDDIPF